MSGHGLSGLVRWLLGLLLVGGIMVAIVNYWRELGMGALAILVFWLLIKISMGAREDRTQRRQEGKWRPDDDRYE